RPGVRKGNNILQEIKLINNKTTPTRAKALVLKKQKRADIEIEKSSDKIRKVYDTRLRTKDKLNDRDKKNQTRNTTVTEIPKVKVSIFNTTKIQTEQLKNSMTLLMEGSGKILEPEPNISFSYDQSADVSSEQAQAASIDKRSGLLELEADRSNGTNHSEEESQ
ncbi:5729_t:CDS:2, partial [Scutellospora calospora]